MSLLNFGGCSFVSWHDWIRLEGVSNYTLSISFHVSCLLGRLCWILCCFRNHCHYSGQSLCRSRVQTGWSDFPLSILIGWDFHPVDCGWLWSSCNSHFAICQVMLSKKENRLLHTKPSQGFNQCNYTFNFTARKQCLPITIQHIVTVQHFLMKKLYSKLNHQMVACGVPTGFGVQRKGGVHESLYFWLCNCIVSVIIQIWCGGSGEVSNEGSKVFPGKFWQVT